MSPQSNSTSFPQKRQTKAPAREVPGRVDGFTPIFDAVAKKHGLVGAAVFGVIWRHCQMSSGVCYASQETLAELLGISRATVNRYAQRFVGDGYLRIAGREKDGRAVYADTGKASIIVQAVAVERENLPELQADDPVTESYRGCNTELQGGVTESYTKRQGKRERIFLQTGEPDRQGGEPLPANAGESVPSLPSDRQSFESKEPEQAREGLSGKPAGPSPDRRKKLDQLQAHFLEKVGVPPPPTNNEAAAKKANKLWWTPLREILDWVDWDADRAASLVSWAVDEMRDAGLTISNPNSILEKARALMGEMNRGAQPGVIKEMGGGVFLAPDGDGFYG